ncbi:MAG: undecaprenyl-diphosphate phosphatase [Clostridia bacterium]|jgi:undecaprenyl-diphosphatase|nr:undecaprenyl-diphosphate phosphatase [Clostridia bacterium]
MGELIKAIILGFVQGFTEFLPVSSSGHLLVFRKLFGLAEAGLFLDTMLHFGTLVAVLAVFWRDVWDMIRRPFSRLTLLVVTATIPTALIGLLFKDLFEELAVSGVTAGWEFLATGVILWLADSLKDRGYKNIEKISYKDALVVGTLQGVAILPAISRSGLTIAGAFFQGIDRNTAARFSFLVSIPAIMGAVVLQSKDLLEGAAGMIGALPLAAGTLMAAVTGYIAVKWMLSIIRRGSLKVFAVYVWILGAIILVLQLLGKF